MALDTMSSCSLSSRNSYRNPSSIFPLIPKSGKIHLRQSKKLDQQIGWLDEESVKAESYKGWLDAEPKKVLPINEKWNSQGNKLESYSGRLVVPSADDNKSCNAPSKVDKKLIKFDKHFTKFERQVVKFDRPFMKPEKQPVNLAKVTNSLNKEKGALTPTELLHNFSLPVAAYFCSPDAPPGVDVTQPLMLYKNYSSTKVRASSLQINKDSIGLVHADGPTLVIPDTYSGWFSLVTEKGRTATSYSTIEELAKVQPTYFLTRFEVPAYVSETTPAASTSERPKVTYRRIIVQSGQVLKMLGVFEDRNNNNNNNKSRSPDKKHFKSANYIQCLSHKNEILFIPFSATGKFYETAQRDCSDSNHIYLLSQILSTFHLPMTVRLVCGYMSRIPDGFTGLLRLEKVEKEAVILTCTMTPEAHATLFEMDATSTFLLNPITDPIFSKSPIFLKTISYCSEEAETWQRQVKILHNVMQDQKRSSFGRLKPNKTSRSNSLNLNIPFVSSLNKVRGRTKERRRTSSVENSNMILKDRDLGVRNSVSVTRNGKDSRSRESRLRNRVFDKIQDMSRNRHNIVNNEFISIRMIDKLSGNGKKLHDDKRKISKQNTYVFQNDKMSKKADKKYHKAEKHSSSQISFENENYATVADDITDIMHDLGIKTSDSLYSEICSRDFTLENIPVVTN